MNFEERRSFGGQVRFCDEVDIVCMLVVCLCLSYVYDVHVAVDFLCDDCFAADLRVDTRLSVVEFSGVLSVFSALRVRQLRRHLSGGCPRLHRHSRHVLNHLPSDLLLS